MHENELKKAKNCFLTYCEKMNSLANSKGDAVSPDAWSWLRDRYCGKLSKKIHENKDYKCSPKEKDFLFEFYKDFNSRYEKRKIKSWNKNVFLNALCEHRINMLIQKFPVKETTETPIEERKEEPVMENKCSIADKLSRVETAISAGLSTDWDKLISDGDISIDKNRMPRILDSSIISGSELLIPVVEYNKARELENQMLGLYNVYLINVEHWKKKPAY